MKTVKLVGYEQPLPIAQIMYVQGRGSYTIVHLVNGETLLVCMGLTALHRRAPQLIKLHISYLANRSFIGSYEPVNYKKGVVRLLNGTKLPVSYSHRFQFLGNQKIKPVVNLTTGTFFEQAQLAAHSIGCTKENLWPHLRGNQPAIKGNRLRYAWPDEIQAKQVLHP